MSDGIPAQVWLLIGIAAAGFAPARYLVEYVVHSPANHDITQPPPENLEWRTPGKFALNLAFVAGLVALAIFIFTPAAARFARSAIFVPLLLGGGLGTFSLSAVARGFANGRISPLIRGFNDTYERQTQPKRYWASLIWNAVLGGGMLALAPTAYEDERENRCSNYNDSHSPQEQLVACNELLAEHPMGDDRVDLLRARGLAYHNLEQYDRALSDYTRAIELDPQDSYSLYNRALVRSSMGNLRGAVEDYHASLRLRPDNEEAYLNRGLIFLDIGVYDLAVADFTRAHELDPGNKWSIANRGIAYAWMNDPSRAEADFAMLPSGDPAYPLTLRGRAILAMQRDDTEAVVAQLTKALERDPLDAWALRMRADAYWDMGLHDLARDEDDRFHRLEESWEKSGPPTR